MSGLLTGQVGETHAWLEVLHPRQGWLGVDPTRGVLFPPACDYIKLAVGRDYSDVSPVAGSFLSKGAATEYAAISAVRFAAATDAGFDDALELLATDVHGQERLLPAVRRFSTTCTPPWNHRFVPAAAATFGRAIPGETVPARTDAARRGARA